MIKKAISAQFQLNLNEVPVSIVLVDNPTLRGLDTEIVRKDPEMDWLEFLGLETDSTIAFVGITYGPNSNSQMGIVDFTYKISFLGFTSFNHLNTALWIFNNHERITARWISGVPLVEPVYWLDDKAPVSFSPLIFSSDLDVGEAFTVMFTLSKFNCEYDTVLLTKILTERMAIGVALLKLSGGFQAEEDSHFLELARVRSLIVRYFNCFKDFRLQSLTQSLFSYITIGLLSTVLVPGEELEDRFCRSEALLQHTVARACYEHDNLALYNYHLWCWQFILTSESFASKRTVSFTQWAERNNKLIFRETGIGVLSERVRGTLNHVRDLSSSVLFPQDEGEIEPQLSSLIGCLCEELG